MNESQRKRNACDIRVVALVPNYYFARDLRR